MKEKIKQGLERELKWGRLYTDDSEESKEATKIIRESGLMPIISCYYHGRLGPVLKYGRLKEYIGLDKIKELIENLKKYQKQ